MMNSPPSAREKKSAMMVEQEYLRDRMEQAAQ